MWNDLDLCGWPGPDTTGYPAGQAFARTVTGGLTIIKILAGASATIENSVLDGCVGAFGVWYTRGAPTDGWRRSGNALLETKQNLDASNPVVHGQLCT